MYEYVLRLLLNAQISQKIPLFSTDPAPASRPTVAEAKETLELLVTRTVVAGEAHVVPVLPVVEAAALGGIITERRVRAQQATQVHGAEPPSYTDAVAAEPQTPLPKPPAKRPRGRAPKGKEWDYERGAWRASGIGAAAIAAATAADAAAASEVLAHEVMEVIFCFYFNCII